MKTINKNLRLYVNVYSKSNLRIEIFKKQKTCTVFLSSYTNTSGSLGEREILWEHEPQIKGKKRVNF